MAGILLSILPKRRFDFSGLDLGATQDIVIAQRIDIGAYCDGVLIVRTHEINHGGNSIVVELRSDGFTPDDPGLANPYFSSSYFGLPITVTGQPLIASSGTPGSLFGRYAALVVTGSRTIPAINEMWAVLSADLLLRSPEDVHGDIPRAVQKAGGCRCD